MRGAEGPSGRARHVIVGARPVAVRRLTVSRGSVPRRPVFLTKKTPRVEPETVVDGQWNREDWQRASGSSSPGVHTRRTGCGTWGAPSPPPPPVRAREHLATFLDWSQLTRPEGTTCRRPGTSDPRRAVRSPRPLAPTTRLYVCTVNNVSVLTRLPHRRTSGRQRGKPDVHTRLRRRGSVPARVGPTRPEEEGLGFQDRPEEGTCPTGGVSEVGWGSLNQENVGPRSEGKTGSVPVRSEIRGTAIRGFLLRVVDWAGEGRRVLSPQENGSGRL